MGVLISFSGTDSAGKSTQARLLSDYLRKEGKKVLITEAMFGYFLLYPLVRVLRAATGIPSGGAVKRNKNILSKLWFIPAFIDIWIKHIFVIRPMLIKYDFVLADRYYTDIWVTLLYYGYLPEWAFELFVRLLPKPHLAFLLKASSDIVQEREKEFPVRYFQEQKLLYSLLLKIIKMTSINADPNAQKVLGQIKKVLIGRFF